jgi:hypothetical protein
MIHPMVIPFFTNLQSLIGIPAGFLPSTVCGSYHVNDREIRSRVDSIDLIMVVTRGICGVYGSNNLRHDVIYIYVYMQHNKKSYETENDYLIFTNKIVIYGNVSWNV